MKVGDIVHGFPKPDVRSLWQRIMPVWLGGRPKLEGEREMVVAAVVTGAPQQTEGRDG